jgi:hypothetical protein
LNIQEPNNLLHQKVKVKTLNIQKYEQEFSSKKKQQNLQPPREKTKIFNFLKNKKNMNLQPSK